MLNTFNKAAISSVLLLEFGFSNFLDNSSISTVSVLINFNPYTCETSSRSFPFLLPGPPEKEKKISMNKLREK